MLNKAKHKNQTDSKLESKTHTKTRREKEKSDKIT